MRTVLSLCDYTGTWSAPYREAGYQVIQVDIKHGKDVRLLKWPGRVHGILMAPPCTHFAVSGCQHWPRKGDDALIEGLQLVDACLRFVAICKPKWWVLENPIGRLPEYLGPYRMIFDPWEYAGWADKPIEEAYTKSTCLWGSFKSPKRRPLKPTKFLATQNGKKVMSSSVVWAKWSGAKRSVTPSGFARAFCAANP